MGRKFVVGDIHGAYDALLQCLGRAGFVGGKDLLIGLGDYTDCGNNSKEVLDFLGKLSSLGSFVGVRGNHDDWAIVGLRWMAGWLEVGMMTHNEKWALDLWLQHGGRATINSYGGDIYTTNLCDCSNISQHLQFLQSLQPYLVIDNVLFVHAGFDWDESIEKQDPEYLNWDRELFTQAKLRDPEVLEYLKSMSYDTIFIGHTATILYTALDDMAKEYRITYPIVIPDINQKCLVNMDTGAKKSIGKLSLMNIHSKEIFQSDEIGSFYGR